MPFTESDKLPDNLRTAHAVENPVASPRVYRFESFSLDSRTGELSHNGTRTPLREQPLQLLLALLEHPGELVTREQLVSRLWPAGTFVDFDRGLNKAINHLREALGDSAEEPHFIETFPRRGYRFIVPVANDRQVLEPAVPDTAPYWRRRFWILALAAACLGIVVAASLGSVRHWLTTRWHSGPQISSLAVIPLEISPAIPNRNILPTA
jgi:DNA-binding winged helix-turn-helix (wHTH) protein